MAVQPASPQGNGNAAKEVSGGGGEIRGTHSVGDSAAHGTGDNNHVLSQPSQGLCHEGDEVHSGGPTRREVGGQLPLHSHLERVAWCERCLGDG